MFVLFIVTTVSVDYAKSAPNAMLPLQLTSGSVGSDLFSTPYKISCGDRIGQLILLKYSNPCWNKSSTFISEVLNWKNSCDFSKHAGFGSTGK